MADNKYILKQHDLEPSFEVQLLDGTTPVDLTSATSVLFIMSNRKEGVKATGQMTVANQSVVDNRGIVSYTWASGDTNAVGSYNVEIQVTWPGNRPQTFPADRYITVDVQKDLGPVGSV